MHIQPVLLVGSGPMAVEYWRVLNAMSVPVTAVGRSERSASNFSATTGAVCVAGGIDAFLDGGAGVCDVAIVAVTVEQLAEVCSRLIDAGVKRILLEKPGALTGRQVTELAKRADQNSVEIFIAYNRRFYASTILARQLIAEEGGAKSVTFEFTEWSHVISGIEKDPRVKANWLVGNSTHVIDLAFHLAGRPTELFSRTSGGVDWHPAASVFVGAGVTENGALFSYHANWASPGRWGVEIMLPTRRLILRPLESLQYIPIGKVDPVELTLDDHLDRAFKPGIYRQVEAFLTGDYTSLCSLAEQQNNWGIYSDMAGYGPDN